MNPVFKSLIPTVFVFLSSVLSALPPASTSGGSFAPLTLAARSAILIDQATGRVLYERNADAPMPPASLAKLMTLHIVYQKIEDRSISAGDVVGITPDSWAFNQAPGSSVMNLQPGQIVTVMELMKGMMVLSGNDAATALAEYVAGSKEKFVRMMNEECRWMGYRSMHFTDPAGFLATNVVTAREFADFCRRYIDLHPQSLSELLSLREFAYPQPWNLPSGRTGSRQPALKPAQQYNGNFLVWDGIDGLKTGHLDDENFTAAVTMKQGDTRLIAVILGAPGRTLGEGSLRRAEDCMTLLSYGFRTFITTTVDIPPLKSVRVWKGEQESVDIAAQEPLLVTVPRNDAGRITYSVVTPPFVVAPVRKGEQMGEVVFYSGGEEIGRSPVEATEEVEQAGFFKRAWDTVMMGVGGLLGGRG